MRETASRSSGKLSLRRQWIVVCVTARVVRGDEAFLLNLWLGMHRDDFSHLFQVIREERGYNYGDYSYMEHVEDRPDHLFPPTTLPAGTSTSASGSGPSPTSTRPTSRAR